jgi:hypothetical protein
MKQIKIALPEGKVIWALNHPKAGGYIRTDPGVGDQEYTIILSANDPGPKEVDLDKIPKWAQNMIISSIKSGEINNIGDSIEEEVPKIVEKKTKPRAKRAKVRKKKS